MFNNKPLFLLEEAFEEFKVASNGKQFLVKNTQTKNSGILPVVVWEHDNRDDKKLNFQAKRGKNSRAKYYTDFVVKIKKLLNSEILLLVLFAVISVQTLPHQVTVL